MVMKKITWAALAILLLCSFSCEKSIPADDSTVVPGEPGTEDLVKAFSVSSPDPAEQISAISLDSAQQGYVDAANRMGFRLLGKLYDPASREGVICSPLSLEYALAMCANGASGQTLEELTDFMGFGNDIDALNALCNKLLCELPAVDLGITLKLTDALLVRDEFPLLPSYQQTVRDTYFAAVANDSFSNPAAVAKIVNDWASRCTNGFIDQVLTESDINPDTIALLMNALYFKARWAGDERDPMFKPDLTRESSFYPGDGTSLMLPMMSTMDWFQYAEMDGYKVLALPYANSRYYMYIFLPDKNDIAALLAQLPTLSWSQLLKSFKHDAEVYVRLPKFELEQKYYLREQLAALGVNRAFAFTGEFDRMFQRTDYPFAIGEVIQKARIAVDEWGTEAGAVTVVEMKMGSAPYEEEPKRVYFTCDHPFAFAIGESTSGAILFSGVYSGK